ncbi:leucine-rich repeat-containing protein 37A3-like [Mixophyes fleayi]|uniref:leucine-rich repeat-containing protein 37A3-like n=1 Tax=Mixophyes fleayi TaxID=3061075 RepID=UPI003F4D9127
MQLSPECRRILKNNLITQLDEDSFEGLLFLKVLDLSMNKIEMVAPHVFQPLPFLQSLNLAGNAIHEIHSGTFETWHGLLLLTSVVLAHNPLESFNDKALYNLGSMTYLDVGATNIPVPAIKTLLKTLPGLTTIILPNSVTCCLCLAQKKNTIRPETVKLHCLKTCPVNTFQCKLNTVLSKFLNSLRVHQINRTVPLTIESERPLTSSIEAKDFTEKRAENMHPLIQVNFPDKDNVLQATISSNYWENQGIMEISIPVYITVGVILIVMCFLSICWKRSTTQKKKPASNDDSEEDSCSQRVCISALYGCEWAEQQAEVERLRGLSRRQK